jgi:threonine/homoserine/homoserine lactone efflux protein
MMISFIGTLPLGTLNVAAMQLSVTDGIRPAIYFSTGALLVEIIYVRFSLVAMDWIRKKKRIFRMLEWGTFMLVIALAISSFYAAMHPEQDKNVILSNTFHRFWLGVMMSAINPLQIPYWFGWSTILMSRKVLEPRNSHYNAYIVGIGLGTFIGMGIFILGGQLLVSQFKTHHLWINWIIGSIFLVTALLQLWKMLVKKDAAEHLEHPEDYIHPFDGKKGESR